MKLFGSKSWSYFIHLLFRGLNYISLFFLVALAIHFLMAWIAKLGISNPIADLNIGSNEFEIHYKLWTDSPLLIPIGGAAGFISYVYTILFGLLIYFFLTLILSRIFQSLSKDSIFMKSLAKNTKFLAWLLIIMSLESIIMSFYGQQIPRASLTGIVTLLFTGGMIWFLSKVFEEGNRIQQEIDLTI